MSESDLKYNIYHIISAFSIFILSVEYPVYIHMNHIMFSKQEKVIKSKACVVSISRF